MSRDIFEMNQGIDSSRRLLAAYDEVVIKGFERLKRGLSLNAEETAACLRSLEEPSVINGGVLVCTTCEEDFYLEWDCEMCLDEHEGHIIEVLPGANFIRCRRHPEL